MQVVASGENFVVVCPVNKSRVGVDVKALAVVDSCPAGAVIIQDKFWLT